MDEDNSISDDKLQPKMSMTRKSHTTDQPRAQKERDTEHSSQCHDSKNTMK